MDLCVLCERIPSALPFSPIMDPLQPTYHQKLVLTLEFLVACRTAMMPMDPMLYEIATIRLTVVTERVLNRQMGPQIGFILLVDIAS